VTVCSESARSKAHLRLVFAEGRNSRKHVHDLHDQVTDSLVEGSDLLLRLLQ